MIEVCTGGSPSWGRERCVVVVVGWAWSPMRDASTGAAWTGVLAARWSSVDVERTPPADHRRRPPMRSPVGGTLAAMSPTADRSSDDRRDERPDSRSRTLPACGPPGPRRAWPVDDRRRRRRSRAGQPADRVPPVRDARAAAGRGVRRAGVRRYTEQLPTDGPGDDPAGWLIRLLRVVHRLNSGNGRIYWSLVLAEHDLTGELATVPTHRRWRRKRSASWVASAMWTARGGRLARHPNGARRRVPRSTPRRSPTAALSVDFGRRPDDAAEVCARVLLAARTSHSRTPRRRRPLARVPRMNGAESLVRTLVDSGSTPASPTRGTSEMHVVAAVGRVPRDVACSGCSRASSPAWPTATGAWPTGRRPRCCTSAPGWPTASRTCTTHVAWSRRSSTWSATTRPGTCATTHHSPRTSSASPARSRAGCARPRRRRRS